MTDPRTAHIRDIYIHHSGLDEQQAAELFDHWLNDHANAAATAGDEDADIIGYSAPYGTVIEPMDDTLESTAARLMAAHDIIGTAVDIIADTRDDTYSGLDDTQCATLTVMAQSHLLPAANGLEQVVDGMAIDKDGSVGLARAAHRRPTADRDR